MLRRVPFAAAVLLALTVMPGGSARAQEGSVDVQNYRPNIDGSGYFQVYGARLLEKWKPKLGLSANYAHRPLEVRSGSSTEALVDGISTLDITLGLTVHEIVSFGVGVPLSLLAGAPGQLDGQTVSEGGLGDLETIMKIQVVDPDILGWFGMSLMGRMRWPTASSDGLLGQGGFRPGGSILLDFGQGPVIGSINFGYAAALSSANIANLSVEDQLEFGAALSVKPGIDRWEILGEVTGATLTSDPFGSNEVQNPLEARLGFRRKSDDGIGFLVGAGGGLSRGAGSPRFRLILALTWDPLQITVEPEPVVLDTDGDGRLDEVDRCPKLPEDIDQFQDDDGCPDPDNDGDGILDAADRCPLDAEDPDGFVDEDGCPDTDNDKDGIPDAKDRCPDKPEDLDGDKDEDGCPEAARDGDGDGIDDVRDNCPADPEDADGYQDEDGCPDNDNDGDGIADKDDQCPDAREDFDDFADLDGCPDTDNDKDGIPDARDQCPNIPEDLDGFEDDDGCAEEGPVVEAPPPPKPKSQRVVVSGKKIEIKESVFFKRGKASIRLEKSGPVLREVAQVLVDNPWIELILIEGHTDSAGKDSTNMRLSQKRAESVRKFLIGRGVEPVRLQAMGFGETRPIANNKSRAGRAKNRRVEFRILRQSPPKKVIEVPAGEQ